jgi:hypothetical protein
MRAFFSGLPIIGKSTISLYWCVGSNFFPSYQRLVKYASRLCFTVVWIINTEKICSGGNKFAWVLPICR